MVQPILTSNYLCSSSRSIRRSCVIKWLLARASGRAVMMWTSRTSTTKSCGTSAVASPGWVYVLFMVATSSWGSPQQNPSPDGIVWDDQVTSKDCEALRKTMPQGYAFDSGPCSVKPATKEASEHSDSPAPTDDYLRSVMHEADACRTSGGDVMDCFVKASPVRCKQSAIQFVSEMGAARRTWIMCVRSCASSGFYASHFGDCRK